MEGRDLPLKWRFSWISAGILCSLYIIVLGLFLKPYGLVVGSLATLPVLFVSVNFGRVQGFLVACILLVANLLLLRPQYASSLAETLRIGLPGSLALLAVSVVAGWLSELHQSLRKATLLQSRLEHNFEQIINSAPDPILTLSESGVVDVYNQAAEHLFGRPYSEVSGQNIQIISPVLLQLFRERVESSGLNRSSLNRTILHPELVLSRSDGHQLPIEFSLSEHHRDGARQFTLVARDLTERKRSEAEVDRLQHYDPMTGAPNRVKFSLMCERFIVDKHPFALFLLDLNGFKAVNDSVGHDAGNTLLKKVVERLSLRLRSSDQLFRLGGDEFLLLLPDLVEFSTASSLARRLLSTFATPFTELGQELYLTAGLGICLYPGHGESIEELYKNAETAMYEAKQNRTSDFRFFSPEMSRDAAEQLRLASALHRAVERNEMTLVYQPQFRGANGVLTGVEALLRWHHPELGSVSPARFVPVAESNGLIVALGEWVFRMACMQLKRWEENLTQDFCVAINLSALQFNAPDLVEMIHQVLKETGVNPQHIELEITESVAVTDVERAVGMMKRLRELGLKLAMDDFGTGYSSLSSLRRFPIDRLKLDRSLVQDIAHDPSAAAVTSAIITLAHGMGMEAIAEGIEFPEQNQALIAQGCNYMQGFLLGKPMPSTGVDLLLNRLN